MSVSLPAAETLGALAARHGGALDPGLDAVSIRALAPIDRAADGELAPLVSTRWLRAAAASRAALLVDASLAARVPSGRRWVHPRAAETLAALLERIAGEPTRPMGVHPRAVVEPSADVDATAAIGPGAVVLAGAIVGPRATIGPNAVIQGGAIVGADARIEANAVIYGGAHIGARVIVGAGAVVGRPGFGWVARDGGPARVPQLGGVLVEDDAEIGPLATVDAGTLAPTVIGRAAKLDAHVHVGHNARIGAGSIVAAQAGFAGSVTLGDGVLVGGQAGVADHVTIGDGARIAAKAGVIGDVAPGATVAGYPAVDRARWLRATALALASPEKRRRPRQEDT